MYEAKITNYSSVSVFKSVLKAIEAMGGRILDSSDYEQLDAITDQMYIDYMIRDKTMTAHLEHYTGIHLLSDEFDSAELSRISEAIKSSV